MRLEGKTAIITGAAKGIGRATAETFAREGCRVVVSDIDVDSGEATAAAIRASGGEAVFKHLDVSVRPDVAALVKEIVGTYGRLDVMVNNAGVRSVGWSDMLAVNLNGVAYGIRYAARAMADAGGGSIISTASVGGLLGLGYPINTGTDAYVAAKHGVVGLTREYALFYGTNNVRINCVCPGAVETDMMVGVLENEKWKQRLISTTALKRLGKPQEIADLFLFLASDESAYITGAAIVIDGGLTAGAGGGFTAIE